MITFFLQSSLLQINTSFFQIPLLQIFKFVNATPGVIQFTCSEDHFPIILHQILLKLGSFTKLGMEN